MAPAVAIRSDGEIAGLYAVAEVARAQTAYRRAAADGVAAALDWVTGETTLAPIAGEALEPTSAAIVAEMGRATGLERQANETGTAAVWLGKVGQTLSWILCEEGTEQPLY